MVALLPSQQQSYEFKVQIFGNFASACENPVFRKNLLNLSNIVLYCTLFYNRHFSYFQTGFLLSYGLLIFVIIK